jgi:predicted Ser/Thr protein kinase
MDQASDDRDLAPAAEGAAKPPVPRIGRYELLERIGRGGMGAVYRARDTTLDRMVAVKMLLTDIEVSDETRERFFREARSAGGLTHRNIITVYDFGEDNGRAYLVMELLQGEALTKILAQERKPSFEHRVDIMARVCDGLAFAHSRGIVHRDVKPANLFLTSDGQVKILDFGVARIASSSLTRVGLIVGTPDYMSPEQVHGRVVDQRSDIFSAGSVFYQLLSGRKPFAAKNLPEVLRLVATEDPPPLADTEAPSDLAAIVMRALRKEPDDRYQQMQDMLADLARFQQKFDQATRAMALRVRDRFLEAADMITEAQTLAGELAIPWDGEEVAVVPLVRDLPIFKTRGADVFGSVPFRRGRVNEMTRLLQHQREGLTVRLETWRDARNLLSQAESELEAGAHGDAALRCDAVLATLPLSGRAIELKQRCRRLASEGQVRHSSGRQEPVAANGPVTVSQQAPVALHSDQAYEAPPIGSDAQADYLFDDVTVNGPGEHEPTENEETIAVPASNFAGTLGSRLSQWFGRLVGRFTGRRA